MVLLVFKETGGKFGVRHLQVLLIFFCCMISYFIRINVSVAVVAMTNNTTNPDFQTFDWTGSQRSYVLSSFFWGYAVTQLPGGYIAQKYGAKYILLLTVLVPSVFSLITPVCVNYGGWMTFCGIRVVQGLFQGFMFPSFHSFLSKWCPLDERNRLVAFAHSGIEVGTSLAFGASGLIAGSDFGWPGISYISGGIGIIWTILWFYLGASNPSNCKLISLAERKLIESSLQTTDETYKNPMATPWLKIFTSVPFLALLCCRTGFGWGFATLLTQIPSYLHYILHMDIQNNSLYSAVPYIVMLSVSYSLIFVADLLQRKKLLSLEVIRKSFNIIAFWIPGVALLGIGFVGPDKNWLSVVLITTAVGANGAHTLGSVLNHIDLSPTHAGVLMGITNTLGNITSIIAPLLVGWIVTDLSNQSQWQIIFGISAILFIFCNLVYLIFGKMEPQPWNYPDSKPEIEKTVDERTANQLKMP